jgi:hypothetical protein
VVSVHQLNRLFDAHRATFILKSCRLVTWDEAKTRKPDLCRFGNRKHGTARPARYCRIQVRLTLTKASGTHADIERSPEGRRTKYLRDERRPSQEDYAIIALLPGVQPGHRILLLTGMTTQGTQAAAEYMCRPDAVAELLQAVPAHNGETRSFEAVLHTTIRGGVPLQTELVAIHAR